MCIQNYFDFQAILVLRGNKMTEKTLICPKYIFWLNFSIHDDDDSLKVSGFYSYLPAQTYFWSHNHVKKC
jgi:hypothetical protein